MEMMIKAAVFVTVVFLAGMAVGIALMAICVRRNECKGMNKEV